MPTLAKPAKGTAQRDRTRRRSQIVKQDKAENAKVKARSGGRCEVWEFCSSAFARGVYRCERRATQVHHMIRGRGQRAVGPSALAERKQHVCDQCHDDIEGKIGGKKLIRIGGPVPHYMDTYRRVR